MSVEIRTSDGRQARSPLYTRIELVRSISVIYVLIAHVDSVFLKTPDWYVWLSERTHFGIGVIVFFVISGFVVTRSLYKRLESAGDQEKGKKAQLAAFYIRRFTRLMPLAVLWAVITLGGAYLFNRVGYFGVWETNLAAFPSSIFYYANFQAFESWGTLGAFGVYWSLAVEEQFYFFIPLLLIFFSRRTVVILLAVLLYVFIGLGREQADYLLWRAIWFDGLLIGVLLYLVFGEGVKLSPKWSKLADILFVFYVLAGFPILAEALMKSETGYLTYGAAASSLMFFWALIRGVDDGKTRIPHWLERASLFIGARSYGLYLSHFTVSMFTREFWHWFAASDQPGWQSATWLQFALFVTWLILTLALTEFFFRTVEKPLTEFGRNFGGLGPGKKEVQAVV